MLSKLHSPKHAPVTRGISTVLSESDFLRTLDVERKRTERTGRPILLILAELAESARLNGDLKAIIDALNECKRETDFLGWYESRRTLGVIFNEITQPDGTGIRSIRSRITFALESRIGNHRVTIPTLSFHIFPEPDSAGQIDLTFYPRVARRQNQRAAVAKRCIDVIGSVILILLLMPVFISVALAIKLTSRGPVLYKQVRVGLFARRFTFLKFRSMCVNNDSTIHEDYVARLISGQINTIGADNANEVFKIVDDPRVTPVGRFLRRSSLDELPQLFNVIAGHMSLVGPRPPLPYEIERYHVWHRRRVVEAKPGITGLWQVSGRSKLTFNDMVRLDLAYLQNPSVWLDLRILLRTPIAVLSADGAY